MTDSLNALLDSRLGRIAYLPFKGIVRFVRKKAHPDVPLDHEVIHVTYRGRQFAIEVRRWNESDRLAVDQCFSGEQYDMPGGAHSAYLHSVYKDILAADKKPLIVDCGANIGASVLWFSSRYPEAHIIAVEPAPDNFELLKKNCRGVNADIVQAGIGTVDGTAWLSGPKGFGMGYRTGEDTAGLQVRIVSLATAMANKPESEYSPFLLKVDIEGAEKALFTSDISLLNRFPLIIMEPHDWMFPGGHTSLPFFRFHAQAGREFAMKHENVASIAYPDHSE